MSNNLTDTNILDTFEKVNFLYKKYQGVANTREDLEWFQERNVKFNDYVKAEDIFLRNIPKAPIFNKVITPEEENLTEEDFARTTNDWGILEDSTGTVRKYSRLILQTIRNTNETTYYKLDGFSNNILKDSIAFNTHMELNSLPIYPQTLTNENAILANSNNPVNIPDGEIGGNKVFDPKSGILHFPDHKLNICNGTDNRPVFTFYRYVGKKGLENIDFHPDQILLTNKDASFNNLSVSGDILSNGDLSINTINYKNINGIRKDYRQHFTIYVSGGNSQTPYYTFTPDITKNYKFVKGNKYTFIGNNISSQHPFSVKLINSGDGKLIFEKNGILKETKYDYDFNIINNESFYIIIPEDLQDNEFQYYCVNHPTSMRKNLKLDRKNIFYKNVFTNSSFTTTNSNIQNLENDIYENILPKNKSGKIKIKIELDYFVCVGRNERISIELWKNNTIINSSNNLGLIFASGGYTNNFSKEIIDSFDFENNINTEIKYYIKYKLENNDSKSEMGIVNVSTNSFIGNSLFLLEEL